MLLRVVYPRVRTPTLRRAARSVHSYVPPRQGAPFECNPDRIITLDALEEHTSSVIFLHGLGDTALGWLGPAWRNKKKTIRDKKRKPPRFCLVLIEPRTPRLFFSY